ncbi:hypothetical protein QVD17_38332 [Tagetes erecta]|uniref:F-box domain-containing protein n=1 Tax=Tagetes erecta TaxID=13708 RepID=A0AAD8JNN5_TARER|nr:hypothetical protein QVD17_38332 [Tagetes erecta]
MGRELPLDLVEQILVGLDVEDVIQCKSVCKSWQSLISTPRFVKAHLNRAYTNDRNNPQLGHRRIYFSGIRHEDHRFFFNITHVVGSCNGLLCVSTKNVKFLVTNPSTREHKKLPTPPYGPYNMRKLSCLRSVVCWGFGYDSSIDDYKVIVGFEKKVKREGMMLFHVLTLKSFTWKLIGEVKHYELKFGGRTGTFCGGALHWLMRTYNDENEVIISLDLSTEEFKEIALPDTTDLIYDCNYHDFTLEMGNENNKWKSYIDDCCESKYDVAHSMITTVNDVYICDDGTRVPTNGDYICATLFSKSLVSPYPHPHVKEHDGNESVESEAKGNLGKRKRMKKKKKEHDGNERVESEAKGNLGKRKRMKKNKKKGSMHKMSLFKRLA